MYIYSMKQHTSLGKQPSYTVIPALYSKATHTERPPGS